MLYQLKVSLVGAKPAIWRRILVQSQLTLGHLHDILQIVMGWEDCHLHQFSVQGQTFSDAETCENLSGCRDESKVLLTDALPRIKDSISYAYDFGDDWEHLIVLEKIVPTTSRRRAEVLVGEGACPLEDIGGLDGWYYFLDVIAHPDSEEYQDEEHQEMREWVEEDFNPRTYDVDAANQRLASWI